MSIGILGGLDRLKRNYEKEGRDRGYKVKVFGQRVPNLLQRLSGVNGIVLFTGMVSHPLAMEAIRFAKQNNIPVERTHSSGMSGFKKCLDEISLF